MERLVDEAVSRVSRGDRGLTDHLPLAPAADVAGSLLRPRGLCPATPFSLGLRPSRSSPQGGGGMPPDRCVHAAAGRGGGDHAKHGGGGRPQPRCAGLPPPPPSPAARVRIKARLIPGATSP